MTATRSQVDGRTDRSWLMNTTPRPRSATSDDKQVENLRLDHDVERGGRLVGDEQLGRQASAIAIITRCFCPPESWCG